MPTTIYKNESVDREDLIHDTSAALCMIIALILLSTSKSVYKVEVLMVMLCTMNITTNSLHRHVAVHGDINKVNSESNKPTGIFEIMLLSMDL